MRRPQQSEFADYYAPYVALVPGENVLLALSEQLQATLPLLSGISEEKSLHRYAPDKWSVRQLLGHVNDTERVFVFRALWFARGFPDPLPGFDQDVAVVGAAADNVAWSSHVEEFKNVRLATIDFFGNLPRSGWKQSGIANDNRVTVLAVAYIISGHLTHHLNILRERYL